MFLRFMQKFKMAAKSGGGNDLYERSPVDSPDTRGVKIVEITLAHTVSEINAFLCF